MLLRHGQSEWNERNLFTGWHDVDLTDRGEEEASRGGRLLREAGVCPTSSTPRCSAGPSAPPTWRSRRWTASGSPLARHWRLNERHYGDLQGRNKAETAEKYGADQVKIWRRSYNMPPPALELDDERHPRFDARYATLPPDLLPAAECLADVVARMLPYWHDHICTDLLEGRTVLVAAHGNSLRALKKHLDGISDEDIVDVNIPTGVPLLYELDEHLRPVGEARYLDPEAAAAGAAESAAQGGQPTRRRAAARRGRARRPGRPQDA